MGRWLFISLLALALLGGYHWQQRPLSTAPGVLVAETPRQSDTDRAPFDFDGFHVTPRAEFELRARVLSAERYRFDAGARLSPLDLALGWGPMSDQAMLDQLRIDQGARWFRLYWDEPLAVDAQQLFHFSANMHMVPAEEWVLDTLNEARPGQVVQLRGLLVDVERDDGWSWRSSLSREDTGGGSCELVFVEHAMVEPPL